MTTCATCASGIDPTVWDMTCPGCCARLYVGWPAWKQASMSAFVKRVHPAEWIECFRARLEHERSPPRAA